MIFKKFYFTVIAYVLTLVVTIAGIFFFFEKMITYSFIFFVILVAATLTFIRWLNMLNDKLAFFFDAVRNDDSSFRFPKNIGLLSERNFNRSLNELNQKIQEARIKIEVQEKFYRSIMENTRTGIISFTSEGIVEFANPEISRMFNVDHISHINRLESIDPKLVQLLKSIKPGERQWVNVRVGSELMTLAVISQEIIIQKRTLRIVSVQDIKIELDRQEMDSWQKLIRILNHEIMNSVTPITTLSTTILGLYRSEKGDITPAEVNQGIITDTIRGLDIIGVHGRDLIRFVDSYRNLTRLPEPEFKEIIVEDFLSRMVILSGSMKESWNDNTNTPGISTFVNPVDLTLLADEKLIARVLLNLIRNAQEAFVSASPDNKIELNAFLNPAGRIVITIRDNGPGIENETLDKIFIPFYTTKEAGTGIGLSLSRQIMRLHNGTITCISSSPGNTVFSLVF